MSENTIFLLHAFYVGLVIIFVYDWLLVLRKVFVHGGGLVSLEDLGFWIFCALYVFSWMYRESNGTLRWFAVAAAFTAMFLYKKTLSPLFIQGASGLLLLLGKLLSAFLRILLTPIRRLRRRAGRIGSRIMSRKRKIMGNCKIRLKSFAKALKIRLKKQ